MSGKKYFLLFLVISTLVLQTQAQQLPNFLDIITSPFKAITNAIFGNGGAGQIDPSKLPALAKIIRQSDGSGNNLNNKDLGKTFSQLHRLTFPAYADGKGKMLERGNPRTLSNIIGAIKPNQEIINNRFGLNMLFLTFGQMIDHDIGFTTPSFQQKSVIKVSKGDPHFDPQSQGNKSIQFSRSKFHLDNQGVRQFVNELTNWLDGSVLYGSDAQVTKALRTLSGGKMKTDNNMLIRDRNGAFLAGEVRVSENVGLTSLITVFYREHNRICDVISKTMQGLRDEDIFQIARNRVVGYLQKITFKDYLPLLLGKKAYDRYVGEYRGYDSTVDPTLSVQFSSAYRIGHPLLNDGFDLINLENKRIKELKMKDIFVSFQTVKKPQEIDFILNGLFRKPCKQRNNQIVDGIRNLFVQFPGIAQDLFSLNVQRGRDQGLPDFNAVRRSLGMKPLQSFEQISKNKDIVSRLKKAYHDDIDNFDFWVGIISEQPLIDGNMGAVGSKIVGESFRRIRDGDRFWYQSAYPKEEVQDIESTSLGDIIFRNTGLQKLPFEFRKNSFLANPFGLQVSENSGGIVKISNEQIPNLRININDQNGNL